MECNKDEATRAKEIAERKFLARDITGAKKFALKAQNLYPGLEGLPQMLATLDVYLSAENKMNGEEDWYGILGVSPFADDEAVKKQYRKLLLMLHPDKNKSIGADGAFKLISEAWSLLSDKTKKVAYDHKRSSNTSQQRVPPACRGPSAPSDAKNFFNFTNSTNSNTRAHKKATRVGPTTPASRSSKPDTFWTTCHRCKMQYEYVRMYLNQNLLCPNCHGSFFAVETAAPPSNGSNSSTPLSFQQWQNTNQHTADKNAYASGRKTGAAPNVAADRFTFHNSFNQANIQQGPFSRMAGVGGATASTSFATQTMNEVQKAYGKEERKHEVAQAAARKQEDLRRKHPTSKRMAGGLSAGISSADSSSDLKGDNPIKRRRGVDYGGGIDCGGNIGNQMDLGNVGLQFKRHGFEMERVNGFSFSNKLNSTKELSQLEVRNMLMEKARVEIRKKLHEWSATAPAAGEDSRIDKVSEIGKEKNTSVVNGAAYDQKKSDEFIDTMKGVQDKKASLDNPGIGLDTKACEPMSINVPDPDFHDFDKDRSERSFGENQVWAAYDDDDGMPRYYAMVHSVISLNPFKMRIGWLNSKTNSELGPLDWIESGFSKTCGDFKVGRYEINDSLNSFSHRVSWTKGTRGAVRIFPRKGDVWALYRNWSPDWNEKTLDEVIHRYDMVEVLDDYDEEGVSVAPLVKVTGFKTVFHRHLDSAEVKRIPKEEMFRFSHQVPSYLLTGQEARNAPKGCRELDPAATPVELLQIITETKEEELVEKAEEHITIEAKKEKIAEDAEKI